MSATIPFKRLILRAVLRDVSPMVARLISVSDDTELSDLHDVFRQVLGWSGDLGYSFRIHGMEFNSFRGRTRSKPLREFRLHRQEKFLYICDLLDMWEWEVRVMDIQDGATEDPDPLCLGGRGAAPPESCGGSRGYRLMLKRQQQGAAISDPALVEATIQLLSATHPAEPAAPGVCCGTPFVRGGKTSIGDSLSTDRWNQVASVCKKPTSDCQDSPTGGPGYEVPCAGDLRLRSRRTSESG